MKFYYLKALFFLLFLVSITNAEEFSFQKILQSAMENSSILKQKKIDTKISITDLEEVESILYPTLSLSIDSEYSKKINDDSSGGVLNSLLTEETKYNGSATINLNYELTRFGGISATISSAEKAVEISKIDRCLAYKSLQKELLALYHKLRLAKIKQGYNKKISSLYQKIYTFSKKLRKSGNISTIELSKAALNVADSLLASTKIEDEITQYALELQYLSSADVDSSSTLLALNPYSKSFNKSFEETLEAKTLRKVIQQKEFSLNSERKAYFPKVSLYGKYDYYGTSDKNNLDAIRDLENDGYRVGVYISWNIFDGFKREANIERKILEVEKANLSFLDAKLKYKTEQQQLNEQILTQKQNIPYLNDAVNEKQEILSMTKRLYESGETDKISNLENEIELYYKELELHQEKETLSMYKMQEKIENEGDLQCEVL